MSKKNKIGRNEPCPCGSGIKYKKCCLKKFEDERGNDESLSTALGEFNLPDLVSTLGAIQLWPSNHSHTIRLEEATRIACLTKGGDNQVDPSFLVSLLNKILPADGPVGIKEDPPENLFTENIVFHGGNYILYSGISDNIVGILRKLLAKIFVERNDLPEEFKIEIRASILAVLAISNEIAQRVGHFRYMDSPNTWRQDIESPPVDEMPILIAGIKFSIDQLNAILRPMGINLDALDPFILSSGDRSFGTSDFQSNPLFLRPILKISDLYIIALPGSLASALSHHIWFTARKHNILDRLAYEYRIAIKSKAEECFHLMSYKDEYIKLPYFAKELPFSEMVFSFDYAKLAYVQIVSDNAIDYDEEHLEISYDSIITSNLLDLRRKEVAEYLINEDCYCCRELFLITVFGSIGRGLMLGFSHEPEKTRTLMISIEDLEIITQLRHADNLTLWKFAGALNHLPPGAFQPVISQIDLYALYLDHKHSFYLDDNIKQYSHIMLEIGYGQSLRIKAAHIWDTHAAMYGSYPIRWREVCRFHDDMNIPIYFPSNKIGQYIEFLVEGYIQPIWIGIGEDERIEGVDLNKTSFSICEMIAYWVWQFTPSIKSHLEALGRSPIKIEVYYENPSQWCQVTPMRTRNLSDEEKYMGRVEGRVIKLILPDSLLPWLNQADNYGERLVCEALLFAFNTVLEQMGVDGTIDESVRQVSLDTHVPLGIKKKLFLFNIENDISLNPQNLPDFRLLQEHDIEAQLDNLVEYLGEHAPPLGPVEDVNTCIQLCSNVVDIFYERLKNQIQLFNWKPLLISLIGQHEAIWHLRAMTRLTIPTSIACYTDIESRVKELNEEIPARDRTAVSIRTLIEIVAALSPRGEQLPSMDACDQLLAVTYNLINWASLHDQFYYGLYDRPLAILKSGRIGISKEGFAEGWDSFLTAKTYENVDNATDRFEKEFKDDFTFEEKQVVDPEYEMAFAAEFGLTMEKFMQINSTLISIGNEQTSTVASCPFSVLIEKLADETGLDKEDVKNIVDILLLSPREKWEEPPPGFSKNDIWPWKYNRRLSYLRRPLVKGPEPEHDPLIVWGFRHIYNASKQFFDVIFSGRYNAQSQEMITLMGKINNKKGKQFTKKVYDWLGTNTTYTVDMEVPLRPGKKLNPGTDLGDIDILAIDTKLHRIFSIECKNIESGRNTAEIASEIRELLGDAKDSKALIEKHQKRDDWLRQKIPDILEAYGIDLDVYQLVSIFLTKEELPAAYVRTLPLPLFSFAHLKREGVVMLESLGKQT